MERRIFYISLLGLALSACSSVETRKQAKGDFDYVNIKPSAELNVPESMTPPAQSNRYQIPQLQQTDGVIGAALDIRAPSQVLPLASGSRVDEFDKSAAIWYDKVDDNRDLKTVVVSAIKNVAKDENVEFVEQSDDGNRFESGWFTTEQESGIGPFKDVESIEKWRFAYSLVTKPHGRSIGLNVELVEYFKQDQQGTSTTLSALEKNRVEMEMLNSVTSELGYLYRLNRRDDAIARANMQIVTLADTANGEPALSIDFKRDQLWTYLPGFFEQYNFTVTDLDESNFIYDVQYTQADNSVWQTMWGDDKPVLTLADGDYRFKLVERDGKTDLLITDKDNNNVGEQVLKENFESLEPGLSFR
ncbi:outer membrane protein assembly factor BamC [Thalassotalea ponticola]|uniref:outer membrane protein assembly factor BamC n=1 Tax=Thalassotalea ponticola TaxID=1523392 RepID=UPI0025B4647F|nr:outer membrane protein assembly factor BamC [Thalassotalea ponticola]MDN3653034.1 outer membrane protein assembly factor BamC [Thalassotalea ponticola]